MNDLVDTGFRRDDARERDFCRRFLAADTSSRYIFGTNPYARAIGAQVAVQGYIDDFTQATECAGRPVLRTEQVPTGSLVVSAVVLGRPWSATRRLDGAGLENLDYYAFTRHAGLDLPGPFFWPDFGSDFNAHRAAWDAVYARLADDTSRRQFRDIINFRLSGDLHWMAAYADIQHRQYFEDFLGLKAAGEVFADVGGFDGFTTTEFIRRCPEYGAVHFFEPEAGNMASARQRLGKLRDIHYHPYGLSDRAQTLRFSSAGSGSRISSSGDIEIRLERFDDAVRGPVSFIKMDIEGAESQAIAGARESILRCHPRLAIAAYHLIDDFRRIPAEVFAIRDDYDLYLRHYTEGTTETVLFFVPRGGA